MRQYALLKPKIGKAIGIFLVIFGFIMLVTPLTPGGLLFFVGLELLGIRLIDGAKIKRIFERKPALETTTVKSD